MTNSSPTGKSGLYIGIGVGVAVVVVVITVALIPIFIAVYLKKWSKKKTHITHSNVTYHSNHQPTMTSEVSSEVYDNISTNEPYLSHSDQALNSTEDGFVTFRNDAYGVIAGTENVTLHQC